MLHPSPGKWDDPEAVEIRQPSGRNERGRAEKKVGAKGWGYRSKGRQERVCV